MRIAVCVKQVPDTETKIKLTADGSNIDTTGIKWVVNPYDEHAIEESIKLRDANPGSQIVVFGLGPKARVSESLRTALAMGADEAVVVDAPENLDNSLTAKALARALKKEGSFDMVLTGKLAIDDNSASVSQMIAHELNYPHVTVVSKLTVSGPTLSAEREVEGGTKEIYEVTLPTLIAANKGLNVPRYASLPGIMKAKKKTIKELDLPSLDIALSQIKVRYTKYSLPPAKPAVKMLNGEPQAQAKQVAQLLREEAKII